MTVSTSDVPDHWVVAAIQEAVAFTLEHRQTAFVYKYGSIPCVSSEYPKGENQRLVFITHPRLCKIDDGVAEELRQWVEPENDIMLSANV